MSLTASGAVQDILSFWAHSALITIVVVVVHPCTSNVTLSVGRSSGQKTMSTSEWGCGLLAE